MSNEILNLHVNEGEPAGKDCGIFDIADYYGHRYAALVAENEQLMASLDRVTCDAREMANTFLREYKHPTYGYLGEACTIARKYQTGGE